MLLVDETRLGPRAPSPVRKIQYRAGDNNALNKDLALVDGGLQHLKMNIPRLVSRADIVDGVLNHTDATLKSGVSERGTQQIISGDEYFLVSVSDQMSNIRRRDLEPDNIMADVAE